tara:strand:- start:1094 stop:2200 length:1107 start_codon:yes stop_codon:yes gene_type:complete
MTDIKKWDKIDNFLYYDYWHRNGHKSSVVIREGLLKDLIKISKVNHIEIYLRQQTLESILINKTINPSAKLENLAIRIEDKNLFLSKLKKFDFTVIENNNKYCFLFKDKRLIKLNFFSKVIFKKNIEFLGYKFYYFQSEALIIKSTRKIRIFCIKLLNKLKYLFYKCKNFILFSQLARKLDASDIKRGKVYPLNEKAFLNLRIEPSLSPNWIMRRQHLDIVSNNKKYTKVKDVVKYFKNKENLENATKQINETINFNEYDEPISHNKLFWDSGNNYFINNLLYGFRKNVTSYTDANNYIISQNKPNLYSKEYYESLEKMSDIEIKKFFIENPIEVTNNCVTSGKHRMYAMIGSLINDESYITIYAYIY